MSSKDPGRSRRLGGADVSVRTGVVATATARVGATAEVAATAGVGDAATVDDVLLMAASKKAR
jgi:hypothetical protein